MLILNERKFIEDCLAKRIDVVKIKFSRLKMLRLVTIYFDCNIEKVKASMKKLYGDFFMLEHWDKQIVDVINRQENEQCKLIENEYIEIYECDINAVKQLKNEKLEKVYFTSIILARFYNNNGWIGLYSNRDIKGLFDMANVKVSPYERYMVLGELERLGCLRGSKSNNNINEQVVLNKPDMEYMRIQSFIDLGNQYLHKTKNGYKMCTCCGKMYKTNPYDRCSKYCKKCAKVIKNQS